jgi:hypothetical protein
VYDESVVDLSKSSEKKEDGLQPLFLFLTSALNVEMVYVILQGISQFSLLNFVKDGMTKDQLKKFQSMECEKGWRHHCYIATDRDKKCLEMEQNIWERLFY